MDQNDNLICEMRHCPACGTEIFCKSGSNNEMIYFISETLDQQIQACPGCQFDLIEVPIHILDMQPKPAGEEMLSQRRKPAGIRELTEAVFKKDPQIFATKKTTKQAIRAIGEVFFDLLSTGVDVKWSGLGSLKIHERKSRIGRNPVSGEALQIPAKKGIKFVPSKALREKLNR